MKKTRHIIFLFIPALLIVGIALFIRVIQYKPLYPTQEQLAAYNDKSLQIPILPGDPILGEKKAPITLIAFEDFACPTCIVQSNILNQLLEKYPGQLKIIWKGLPVKTYPYNSRDAHLAAFCVHEQQQFDLFKNLAFTNSQNLSPSIVEAIVAQIPDIDLQKMESCLNSEPAETHVTQTEQIATNIGIQTVPTFFINNKQVEAPATLNGWELSLGLIK
jgi:protein-disulfide isomerase